jgi:macrolide transport system ATP-binding/permease protein
MSPRRARAWLARLAGLVTRNDRELAEELESHLQMHVDDNVRAGMSPDEARRHALVKLGGLEAAKEGVREQRALPLVETLSRDVRHGVRRLVRSPGFTVVALLSLTLGIGANTAIFSLLNTAALRPLPVERADELVSVANATGQGAFPTLSYPNYRDLRDRSDAFSGLIAYRFAPLSMSYDGVNERLWGYVVTGNYFEVLGVRAAIGRLLSPDDDRLPGAHPVAVVSYECWQRRFGGTPDVLGKSLVVNGRAYTVVGVAPEGFFGTEIIAAPELWFPMAMQAEVEVGNSWLEERGVENVFVQGRLAPGAGVARAQASLDALTAELAQEFPDVNEEMRVTVAPPGMMGGMMRGAVLGFTALLMVVVAFVLLLACTNLANLLLARSSERRREIAVRLAMGASRGRLVRELMTESMLLALGSGALGYLLAYSLVRVAVLLKPPVDVPLSVELHMDYRVLAFTCAVSLVTGVLFGLLPALQATKVDLLPALKDEASSTGFHRSWWKGGLVVLQIALSLLLLVGGGLMVRALQRAQTVELGFEPEGAVEASFDLRLQGYDAARGKEFQKALLERLRARPEVRHAGIVDLPPVDLHFSRSSVVVEGRPPEREGSVPRAMASRVSPGYFQAIGTRLLQGRDFTDRDDESAARVAIVNETFVRRFWPGEDPIGRRFSVGSAESPAVEVVGVVEDGKYASLGEAPQPYFCRPLSQAYLGMNTVVVRSDADPQSLLAAIRAEVRGLDPQLPLASAKPLVDRMAMPLLPARMAASVLGTFGLVALALAAIGIYGVMSNAVARRTREIGVRVALGAQAADVLRLAMRQGMVPVVAGVAIGMAAALALMQMAKGFLFGVSAADPLTYGAVTALLVGVALLACYVPARRAARVDPMVALRSE